MLCGRDNNIIVNATQRVMFVFKTKVRKWQIIIFVFFLSRKMLASTSQFN